MKRLVRGKLPRALCLMAAMLTAMPGCLVQFSMPEDKETGTQTSSYKGASTWQARLNNGSGTGGKSSGSSGVVRVSGSSPDIGHPLPEGPPLSGGGAHLVDGPHLMGGAPVEMGGGCAGGVCGGGTDGAGGGVPHELDKVMHPAYVIEPPDILFIDAIRVIPKPPYRIEPLDILLIQVAETLPGQPIAGPYSVAPDGTVNLGYSYGAVRIAGLTLEQAANVIKVQLSRSLRDPQVAVALAQFRGVQQTRGEHLVNQDGTITLGTYGCVNVTGLTLCQAKAVIEKHLSKYLLNPEVSLSVRAFNSKVYYVIFDGGGFGQQVFRLPITGNETVLDALSQLNGLPPISSKKKLWLARPAPCDHGCYQILPINWQAIVQAGDTCTNYQIFPGDRIYVKANCLLAINNYLGQFLAPIEQVFGATLLGAGTFNAVRNVNNRNNTNGLGF